MEKHDLFSFPPKKPRAQSRYLHLALDSRVVSLILRPLGVCPLTYITTSYSFRLVLNTVWTSLIHWERSLVFSPVPVCTHYFSVVTAVSDTVWRKQEPGGSDVRSIPSLFLLSCVSIGCSAILSRTGFILSEKDVFWGLPGLPVSTVGFTSSYEQVDHVVIPEEA